MNYKNQLTLLISAGLLLFCSQSALAGDEGNLETKVEGARYKIFIAEHEVILNKKIKTMRSIFKLDKKTGTVWRYRWGVDSKNKSYEEFFEVPNQ